jgi:hypothetical protein
MFAPPGAAGREHHTRLQWGNSGPNVQCMPVSLHPAHRPCCGTGASWGVPRGADMRTHAAAVRRTPACALACRVRAATPGAPAKPAVPRWRWRLVPVCSVKCHGEPATPIGFGKPSAEPGQRPASVCVLCMHVAADFPAQCWVTMLLRCERMVEMVCSTRGGRACACALHRHHHSPLLPNHSGGTVCKPRGSLASSSLRHPQLGACSNNKQ